MNASSGEGAGVSSHPTASGSIVLDSARALRWLEAVPARHARRSYTGVAVSNDDLDRLGELASHWVPWSSARAVVIREAPASIFAGVVGAYGGVSQSPSALVFIGDDDGGPETVGYTGEALILEATALGLDTCWIAGLFRAGPIRELVRVGGQERVYAVSALGYASQESTAKERLLFGAGRPKVRRELDEIAPGHEGWPAWVRSAVVAARIAPSAMNRQPWRFTFDGDALSVAFAGRELPRTSKRLDCGIAMLHAQIGALSEGVSGQWELLPSPDVARFVPHGS